MVYFPSTGVCVDSEIFSYNSVSGFVFTLLAKFLVMKCARNVFKCKDTLDKGNYTNADVSIKNGYIFVSPTSAGMLCKQGPIY